MRRSHRDRADNLTTGHPRQPLPLKPSRSASTSTRDIPLATRFRRSSATTSRAGRVPLGQQGHQLLLGRRRRGRDRPGGPGSRWSSAQSRIGDPSSNAGTVEHQVQTGGGGHRIADFHERNHRPHPLTSAAAGGRPASAAAARLGGDRRRVTKSAHRAKSLPPPTQYPCTWAITGLY